LLSARLASAKGDAEICKRLLTCIENAAVFVLSKFKLLCYKSLTVLLLPLYLMLTHILAFCDALVLCIVCG